MTGVDGYKVYRSVDNVTYAEVYDTSVSTITDYTDTGLTTGQRYYYKVTAYAGGAESAYSVVVFSAPVPATFTPSVDVSSTSSILITWTDVDGANGYEITRAVRSGGPYVVIKRVPSHVESFTDLGLKTGQTYYYKMRAYVLTGSYYVYGGYSPTRGAVPSPDAPTISQTGTPTASSYSMMWRYVSGATGFRVYRSVNSGDYSLVATLARNYSKSTYTDSSIVVGSTYRYKVRPYVLVSGAIREGAYSNILSYTSALGAVTGLRAVSASTTSIRLSWAELPGATNYFVYRYVDGTSDLLLATLGKTLYCYDTGLTVGEDYTYYVKGYSSVGGTTGPASAMVTMHPMLDAPANLRASSYGQTITLTWTAVTGASGYRIVCTDDVAGSLLTAQLLPDGTQNSTLLTVYPSGNPFAVGDSVSVRVQAYIVNSDGSNSLCNLSSVVTVTVR